MQQYMEFFISTSSDKTPSAEYEQYFKMSATTIP